MSPTWIAAALCLVVVYLVGLAFPQFRLGRLLQLAAVALWTLGRAVEAFEAALGRGLGVGVRAMFRTARATWLEGVQEVGR